jgi:hypothetical protein
MDSKEEIPFGWKRQNGAFIKNDLEQWIIKRIQDETCSGKSLDEITLDLTRVGVKPRNGGLWFPRRIKKVLAENEKMRGSLISESKPTEEDKPLAQVMEQAHADPLPQTAPILTSSIRPGAIDYRIRDCCQTACFGPCGPPVSGSRSPLVSELMPSSDFGTMPSTCFGV